MLILPRTRVRRVPSGTSSRRWRVPALVALAAVLATSCGRLEPLSTAQALERLNVATTKLYATDGSLIANLHGEINRDIVTLDDIPRHVQNAVIAIEDERFWTHRGIDVKSIMRALVANVGAAAGDSGEIQGGSTISQQLVKNLYFSEPERTIARKLSEAQKTWAFEQQYDKRRILEMYLNTIYFGRGVYGIQTASRSYFGKDAAELSLAEGAYLAGLIHEPARYEYSGRDDPDRRHAKQQLGIARRNLVLRKMTDLGFVSTSERDGAAGEALEVQDRTESRWRYPYYVDMVLTQLGVLRCNEAALDDRFTDLLGDTCRERQEKVYRGGLRIHTSLDPKVQEAAEEAIDKVLPESHPRLFGAVAAVEPNTGYVRALVGGKDYYPEGCGEDADASLACRYAKVNLALGELGGGSGRQPGSSFKPFVLAAALERGVSLYKAYGASPFTQPIPGSAPWRVNNYEGSGGGAMSVYEGTVNSVNAVYAHLEVDGVGEGDPLKGSARVAELSRELGIGFPTTAEMRERCGEDYMRRDGCIPADATPAIALGAKEVSPLEMASAYSTFANEGVRVEPTVVVRIADGSGRTLYEAEPRRDRVLPSGVALGVSHVLQDVIERGTGTRARIDRPAAGKTGTAQQWRDAWFAGYVPQLAAVVWVGNPEKQEEMTPSNGYPLRVTGGSFPAMIWNVLMTKALAGVPVERFRPPPRGLFQDTTQATPGPETQVPDVLGLARADAVDALANAGFAAAESSCLAPSAPVEGIVVKQTPAGGSFARMGSTVSICMAVHTLPPPSLGSPDPGGGPGPDPGEQETRYAAVPNVVGESRARAHSEIARAGFEMASIRECAPDGGEAGRVWKQSPPGGSQAKIGSTVTVWYEGAGCD